MSKSAWSVRRCTFARRDRFAAQLARRAISGGINKDDPLKVACHFGQLGRELLSGDHFNLWTMKKSREFPGGVAAEAVVGSKRIAVADD
ncbi:MAG: hypothetical protein ABSF59_02840 [Candidatus Sulfotelmatobacter sp.]